MRKSKFMRAHSFCIILFCLVGLGSATRPAFAQAAIPDKQMSVMPSDPKALMLLAERSNGLTGPGAQAWHVKASFTVLDEGGHAKDQGSYEEFWVSPTKYKRTYTNSRLTQTDYGTESGVLRSGARDSDLEPFTQIRNEIVNPIPIGGLEHEHVSLDKLTYDQEGNKLLCLGLKAIASSGPGSHFVPPAFCLDANVPALRVSVRRGEIPQFIHTNILVFQGRYLPQDLTGAQGSKPVLQVHVDTVETIKTINDADFAPSRDAMPTPPLVTISSAVAQGLELRQIPPEYPPAALLLHVTGTVVLQAIIGKDGRILSLSAISGPAMLQQVCLDAVKEWVYKPYLLNNEPTEVNTTIKVVFPVLGRPQAVP
jgi:hypothetical protein